MASQNKGLNVILTSSTTVASLPLGTNLDDGSEALLSPTRGPLLIFGTSSGSGASFALKKLFAGLAEGWKAPNGSSHGYQNFDDKPPLLFSTASSRYKRVAEAHGADFIAADPAAPVDLNEPHIEHAGDPRIYQADPRRLDSSELLRHLLLEHIQDATQMYHVLADTLDELLTHEIAFALLWWAFRYGPERGVFGAAVADGSRLGAHPDGKKILSVSRQLLVLRTRLPERLPISVTRTLKASGVDPASLKHLPQGHGVLVHKPKRGDVREPAIPVRIDATEEQRRVFNTDPAIERKNREDLQK